MSEKTLSMAADPATHRRVNAECARLGISVSEFFRRFVDDYFNPKVNEFEETTTAELAAMNATLQAMQELTCTMAEAIVDVRAQNRKDLAAFFKVIMRNPELLPDPDKASKENIEALLQHIGMDDV